VFLAGGVPEVMLHLRDLNLLDLKCLTVSGEPLGRMLEWWQNLSAAPAFAKSSWLMTPSIPTM